ncbi:ESF1 homolog [Carcharodon carcharias]|uniref:ESF1 homolog n=1 Tax=Carcharodon carcharias TaxID=13397 RepID=UPI001B7F2F33|nr:ESF1 homolog [Carcharodon carcharias]XP_041068125.1 ESF1 homolog [Carcharodon carcharias]XP_041068134.1 ESF1 homolog [Carcharodon carcharias]
MASRSQEILNDGRFSQVMTDPRFWEMPDKERKIKIDKRFQGMFHDKKFKLNYTMDKRGRPINHSTTEDLKRFYDLDSDDSDLGESEGKKKKRKGMGKKLKQKEKSGPDVDAKDSSFVKKKRKQERFLKSDVGGVARQKTGKELETEELIDDLVQVSNKTPVKKEKLKSTAGEVGIIKDDSSKSSDEEMEQTSAKQQKSISTQKKQMKKVINRNQDKMKQLDARIQESSLTSLKTSEDEIELESNGTCQGDSDHAEDSWFEQESSGSGSQSQEEEDEETGNSEDDEELTTEDSDSGPDLARGKGNVETSSDEDEYLDLSSKDPEIEHGWGELAQDAPRGDTVSRRLAVCNIDWDKIKANDLLVLFNSFIPQGGAVLSVKIYPSEFGKKKMKEEELCGPVELLDKNLPEDADEDTEEQRVIREKVREHQFKRLKYYYAVVDCDSPETANKLYEECDGMEFESSCSFLDLRFIPDELTFEDEPKDVAADVDLAAYKPKYFTSTALGTSKAELTWDETDHERVTTLTKRFKKDEIEEMDFKAYLASSSEEDEEADVEEEKEQEQDSDLKSVAESKMTSKAKKDTEEQISKYRELLKNIQGKEERNKDMEMEITWIPGLKETTEAIVKKKLERGNVLTPWEQYLEKRKDKKQQKRKQKNNNEDQEVKNAERLSDDEVPSDVDLNDSFFTDELGQSALQQKKMHKKIKKSMDKPLTPEEGDLEKEKAKMALLMMDDEEEDRRHFNYDKIVEQQNLSKKKKKKLIKKQGLLKEDNFQVDVADPRFQAIYTSHLFNLDPSDPGFKKTNATQSILEEKSRQRQEQQKQAASLNRKEREVTGEETMTAVKKPVDHALSLLVKSVKAKAEQFQARKKQKTM